MNLQEMLTTKNPETITDKELKMVSYGLTYGQFDLSLQPRQFELQARLRKIEEAEKAELRKLSSQLPPIEDDPYCDEYAWS